MRPATRPRLWLGRASGRVPPSRPGPRSARGRRVLARARLGSPARPVRPALSCGRTRVRHLGECGPELQVGDDAEEHEAVQRRVLEGVRRNACRRPATRSTAGSSLTGTASIALTQYLEQARRQCFEQPLLGSEDAVDGRVVVPPRRRRHGRRPRRALPRRPGARPRRAAPPGWSRRALWVFPRLTRYRNGVTIRRNVMRSERSRRLDHGYGRPTLVLGGTGKTGRRVAERLRPEACRSASAHAPASRRSTGRCRDLGPGTRGRALGVRLLLPGPCDSGGGGVVGSFANLAVKKRRATPGAPGRPRGGGRACRAAVRDSGAD